MLTVCGTSATKRKDNGTNLYDAALDTVFNHKLNRLNRPALTKTVNTIHSLCQKELIELQK
jgi:hypothetical protein